MKLHTALMVGSWGWTTHYGTLRAVPTGQVPERGSVKYTRAGGASEEGVEFIGCVDGDTDVT